MHITQLKINTISLVFNTNHELQKHYSNVVGLYPYWPENPHPVYTSDHSCWIDSAHRQWRLLAYFNIVWPHAAMMKERDTILLLHTLKWRHQTPRLVKPTFIKIIKQFNCSLLTLSFLLLRIPSEATCFTLAEPSWLKAWNNNVAASHFFFLESSVLRHAAHHCHFPILANVHVQVMMSTTKFPHQFLRSVSLKCLIWLPSLTHKCPRVFANLFKMILTHINPAISWDSSLLIQPVNNELTQAILQFN